MAANYDDVVAFSFGCEDDFEAINSLRKKYLKKGKKFHHVVLTTNPNSKKLENLKKKYPDLASDVVDINDIQQADPHTLPRLTCIIRQTTKVVIRGHGRANSNNIASKTHKDSVTMRKLAPLLKRNYEGNGTIQISLYSCSSGRSGAADTVKGSIAETLHSNLCAERMSPTISAPRSLEVVSEDGKRKVSPIINENDPLIRVRDEGSAIQEQIAAVSILPWIPARKKLQILYDMEESIAKKFFHKGLDSKVIIKPDGSIFFPYAVGDFVQLSDEDKAIQNLYLYCQERKDYINEARQICLGYLTEISIDHHGISNSFGFKQLEFAIYIHLYPYPALLSYIADAQQNERQPVLSKALNEFKDKINADTRLKDIQRLHTKRARETKYKLDGKETDKDKAFYNTVYAALLVATIPVIFFSPVAPILLCAVIGIAASYFLGRGLVYGYRYLQAKQNPKQRVMRRDAFVSNDSNAVSRNSQVDLNLQREPVGSPQNHSGAKLSEKSVSSSTGEGTPLAKSNFNGYGLFSAGTNSEHNHSANTSTHSFSSC